ncbi:hypothetical protein, partial [Metamycoplasma equirhinis]
MPNAVKEWAVGTSFIDAVNKCLAYKDGSGLLQKGIYSATRQAGPSVFNQYIMPAIWVLFFGIIIITTIASFFGGFGRG